MSQLTKFSIRPGIGNAGRVIKTKTNFFEVSSLPDGNIHHYDITITPQVPPTLNRKVFEALQASSGLGGVKPVYDGRKNLFTAKPLPFKGGKDATTFDVTLPEDGGAPAGKRPPRVFKVKIKKVAEINMEDLHRFLERKSSISENILTAIMALNVLIRHKPSMMYTIVRRSFYTNQGSRVLNGGVEVWQGYFQSIRPTPKKMMINVDVSGTTFYESGTLVEMAVKILNKRSVDDLRRIQKIDRVKLKKSLKNLKIYVTHRGENASKRRLRITKLTNTSAANTKLKANGTTKTVAAYFQEVYGSSLKHPFLPCVVVRKNFFLPMEVCKVFEGQRYMRKLNEIQTEDMFKFTCQQPCARANKISQGPQILNYQQNEYMQNFGLEISNEMATVNARVLPTPRLQYHPSSRDASFVPREGSWNMRDKKVATGATLASWACVVFGSERNYPKQAVQHFLKELIATCQDIGMNILNKTPLIQHSNLQGDIEKALMQIWVKAGNSAKSQPQLIVCILPNTGGPLYAKIKLVSDTIIGVATQCIQARYMMQARKQYCANVCLKLNVKLGGMNSFIDPSLVPFITQRPTIIMGAGTTHPAPGDYNSGRIAAVCASMDSKASRYATSIRVQTNRQEMIADLAEMAKELLKTFYQTCGRKPDRILFYRSGVSEGQFGQVLYSEVDALKAACKSLDPKYNPTITYVVMQKRHHTRFFPIDKRDSDRSGNCLPGTVVESTITHPFEFDFYLQSHAGILGTSRPMHYHVLYDENEFKPDSLQTLTYNLCYISALSTRAVSIVPPVYYAYLACRRARYYAIENWNEEDSGSAINYAAVKPDLKRVMYFV